MALIDVVKFNGLATRDWLVYKHYAEDLSTATQLIVNEGQVAAFYKGGRICDVFGPGTYKLETNNLPILGKLINLPYGGKTPFTAEIYYINTVMKLDLNWGTSDPIQLIDPKYGVSLRIRAFGQVGLRITDYVMFLKELIGAMNPSEIVSYEKTLDFYKGFLISKVKAVIAQIIIDDKISALDITAKLEDISQRLSEKLEPEFGKFGMSLVNFYVKSINFPKEDFDRINHILEKKAEFDIMGDSRYVTARTFDVYETAAGNENGVAGAFAAGGVGFGAGAAIAANVPMPAGGMNIGASNEVVCPKCNTSNKPGSRFCCGCGETLAQSEPETVKCPYCSAENKKGSKFCCSCGKPMAPTKCECGAQLDAGAKFCSECGRKVGE